jgi:hypothetical protein
MENKQLLKYDFCLCTHSNSLCSQHTLKLTLIIIIVHEAGMEGGWSFIREVVGFEDSVRMTGTCVLDLGSYNINHL